jgi:hypothetical protein
MTDAPPQENNAHAINRIRIHQQNLNKLLIASEHILNSNAPEHYDIIAIQEPYIDFAGKQEQKETGTQYISKRTTLTKLAAPDP